MATSLAVTDRYDVGVPRQISEAEREIVYQIHQEFSQYQVWRSNFGRLWEETAEIILPTSRNTFFYQSFNWPGQKKTQQQIDGTGGLALHRFCAIADRLVTPRNQNLARTHRRRTKRRLRHARSRHPPLVRGRNQSVV